MTVQIPQAHGEAIGARTQLMQQILAHFQLLRQEDKRHVDAVLKAAGHEPDDYEQYDLKRDGNSFYLDLKPRAAPQQQQALPQQPVNGEAQPVV